MHSLYYFLSTLGGVNDIIIEILAKDLESFAAHAKRSTITTDDVLLMARKSPELQAKIQAIVDKAQSEKQKNAAHKKSRK
jgi:centromere protein S